MSYVTVGLLAVMAVLATTIQTADAKYGFLTHDYATNKTTKVPQKKQRHQEVVKTVLAGTFTYEGVNFEYHRVLFDGQVKKSLLVGIDTKNKTKCYAIRDRDNTVWADLLGSDTRQILKDHIHKTIVEKDYKKNNIIFLATEDRKAQKDCKGRDIYTMDYYPPLRKDQRETPFSVDDDVQLWSKFSFKGFKFEEHYLPKEKVRLLIGINNKEKRCYYIQDERSFFEKLDSPATREAAMANVYDVMKNLKMRYTTNDATNMFHSKGFHDARAAGVCANHKVYRFDDFNTYKAT